MKDKIFYTGVFLIAASFIACMIDFYLIIFLGPVFILGAVLVLFSKRSIRTKLLLTVLPVVLYIPATILFLYLYNFSFAKAILIPEDYEGSLRVVYEEECGSGYEDIDGVETLVFPENGVLILNEEFDSHINYKYYLVDTSGKRTEIINQAVIFDKKDIKLPCVEFGGSGTTGQGTVINDDVKGDVFTSEGQGQKEISYSYFYVYNKEKTKRDDYDRIDSITTELVNQCRARR